AVYIVAFFFAVLVQAPAVTKLLGILKTMPAPPAGGPPPGAGGDGPPPGPPPEVAALVKRTRNGGIFLTVLILVVLFLMIWGPEIAGSLLVPALIGRRCGRSAS